MTPSEIKSVLSGMGGFANKRLGQHFLIDDSVLETIVESANIKEGERVLEVGPGLGVLTCALIRRGADVMAIEQDRRFVEWLQRDGNPTSSPYQGRAIPTPLIRGIQGVSGRGGVMIVHGDAAKTDWDALVGDKPWKFVSNLPYSITSLALRKALWSETVPEKVVVLVQREVAERAIETAHHVIARNQMTKQSLRLPRSSNSLAMTEGKTSLLSLMVAFASSSAKIVKRVPAGCFYPAPKVESAILEILPMMKADRLKKWGMDPEKIMALAKKGFAHPRKLLISNLSLRAKSDEARQSPEIASFLAMTEKWHQVFSDLGLNPKARAEDLSPDDWARLTLALSSESAV